MNTKKATVIIITILFLFGFAIVAKKEALKKEECQYYIDRNDFIQSLDSWCVKYYDSLTFKVYEN